MKLEPWESEPLWLKLITPFLRRKRFSELPESPRKGEWYRIYPEGCVAADGERTYANFQLGTDNKLLVFFCGGGVSWNEHTAARPASLYNKDYAEGFYMIHVDLFSDLNRNKGIFENSERNPFRNWTKVILIYNTGDFHAGNGDFPYTALDGSRQILHHHGYKNYRAVMNEVKKRIPEPDQLFVSGCSGGSFGAALLSDDLVGQFPGCANITCCVDSGFFLMENWADVAVNIWKSPKEIARCIHSNNITLDALTALYQKHGDRVKYLFTCSVRDASLARMVNYFKKNAFGFSRESGDQFQEDLRMMCRQLREKIPTVGLYIFNKTAKDQKDMDLTTHCIIGEKDVYEIIIDSKSAAQWMLDAINGNVEQLGLSLLKESRTGRKKHEIK